MGIVIRQSFWSTIAGYVGVLIGYLNVVILMPKYLTPVEIGLYRTILSTASLIAPIPLFGLRSAFIRFFPRNTYKENNVMVSIGFITFGALLSILIGVAIPLKPFLENFFLEKADTINDYLWLILLLIALIGFYGFVESILKAKKNIAVPSFVKESLYRFLQAIVILLVGFSIISIDGFLISQALIYAFITLIIFFFLVRDFGFNSSFSISELGKSKTKEFFTYSRYALLSGLGTAAVLQIDQIMISKYMGLEANAIYTTAIFMAVVIEMPRRFIAQITQSIVTEDFKAKRFEKIHQDYKRVSINQLIIGSYIFLGIVTNLPNIYALMPNGNIYNAGIAIVYIIGFAKLINMLFSINGEIIVMSDHYRINILLIGLLGLMTVCLNLFLIPKYGIEGAGYASLLTFFLFNMIKFIYIKNKFNFSPFSKWTLPTILIIPSFLWINSLFNYHETAIVDVIIRSALLTIGFFLYVTILKPSKELLNLLEVVVSKIRARN